MSPNQSPNEANKILLTKMARLKPNKSLKLPNKQQNEG
jgi:hypothetical protein